MTTVVCLVLTDPYGRILATQRSEEKHFGFFWEFPGGKMEEGESAELALRREIQEELGIKIGALEPMCPVTHTYEFGIIRLFPFKSTCTSRPCLTLNEHIDAKWIKLSDWKLLQWTPADIPIIKKLLR